MGSYYYPDAYGGPNLDFSGIEQAGKAIGGALLKRGEDRKERAVMEAYAASGGDFNKMVEGITAAGGGMDDVVRAAKISELYSRGNKAPKTVASPQGPLQWDGNQWAPIEGAGPKKTSQEFKQENEEKIKQEGKVRLSRLLGGVTKNIVTLRSQGGMTKQGAGAVDNLQASAESSAPGQFVGRLVGSKNQTSRDNLKNMRATIANQVRVASGMSAKSFDSNYELQTYLNTIADPEASDISNLVAVDVIDQTFGLGGLLEKELPPDLLAQVRAGSAQAMQANPITITDEGGGVTSDKYEVGKQYTSPNGRKGTYLGNGQFEVDE
jgi:hypothetical protein